jgi:hypothetical protein
MSHWISPMQLIYVNKIVLKLKILQKCGKWLNCGLYCLIMYQGMEILYCLVGVELGTLCILCMCFIPVIYSQTFRYFHSLLVQWLSLITWEFENFICIFKCINMTLFIFSWCSFLCRVVQMNLFNFTLS